MQKLLFNIFIISLLFFNLIADEKDRALKYLASLEYNMLTSQIYSNAKINFKTIDIKNITHCMLEQQSSYNLPLAVITDIDETIFLNYKFEEMLYNTKQKFSYKLFNNYVNQKSSIPIQGSISYFNFLSERGIKIIYISNREYITENKTFEHLKELGFPIESKDDLLLLNERKNWTKDKSIRREYISKRYEVIQIFGDNFKDFANDKNLIIKHKNRFGKCWFLLPNPFYGSWSNLI